MQTRRIILLVVISSMMGFASLLFSVLEGQVFSVYSTADDHDAGGYMIVTSMAVLIVGLPLYLIKKTRSYVCAMAGNDHLASPITGATNGAPTLAAMNAGW